MKKVLLCQIRRLTISVLISTSLFALATPALAAKRKTAKPLAPYPVTGQLTPAKPQFEQAFVSLLRHWKIPGASVAVMKNNQLIYARGFGYADTATKQPVEPNSLFRIASVSKLITATAVLKLVQEKKLALNEKVFPQILTDVTPLHNTRVDPRLDQMTLLNVLQMSSGWAERYSPMFGPWTEKFRTMLGLEPPADCLHTVRTMLNVPLAHRPGTKFTYSNLDYCILGLVVAHTAHLPMNYQGYEQYVVQNLLAPLGIQDMRIGSTLETPGSGKEVHYYPYPTQALDPESYLPYSSKQILQKNFSDGGWVASSIDIAKFAQALRNNKILSQSLVRLMQTKPDFVHLPKTQGKGQNMQRYYTVGSKIIRMQGITYWVATGSFTGTNSIVVNLPNGATAVALFNTRPPNTRLNYSLRPQLLKMFYNYFRG